MKAVWPVRQEFAGVFDRNFDPYTLPSIEEYEAEESEDEEDKSIWYPGHS
jgi:hypothetical protein